MGVPPMPYRWDMGGTPMLRRQKMPLVSFIIPLHNRAGELPQTLDGLLAQTSRDWEAVVVDDHSTDGAADVARGYASRDARIKVVAVPDPKRGAPAGRNYGVAQCTGDLIVFLDSDDLVEPTCVERRVAFMADRPSLDFAVWRCQLFRQQPGDVPLLWNADTGEDDLDRLLKMDVPWQTTSPIWRRAALAKFAVGENAFWDESVPSAQDWEFHIRAVAAGLKYERVPEIDCHWRLASAERESIGKSSTFAKPHALARPAVNLKMAAYLDARGLLTPQRKRWFGAMQFRAAETIAERSSRKTARAVWRDARDRGFVTPAEWRQGDRYFFAMRWPSLAAKRRLELLKTWPADLRIRKGKFFNVAPVAADRAPTLSVIVSAYNSEAYVREAIQSVLSQRFRDFELIVIDDGSKDATGDVLQEFADGDARVRLVRRANKGLTVSLNEALAMSCGRYVARMDADDVSLKTRFEKQLAYLEANPDCVLLGTGVILIDPLGVPLVEGGLVCEHDEIDRELLKGRGGALYHPSVMMRRDALARVGGYREEFNNSEDLDLFLRLAEIGQMHNLREPLLHYRRHPESVNHTRFENQAKIKTEIVRQAYARRGLAMPADWTFKHWRPEPHATQYREWGWNAIKKNDRPAARAHAWHAIRLAPTQLANWKLLRSALRGR